MEQAILDSLSAPLLVADRQGTIHYGNPAAGHFWRIPEHRLGGLTLTRLFGAQSSLPASVHRAIEEEVSFTIEGFRLQRGETLPPVVLRVQIDPVQIPDRPVKLALIVLMDQTRSERLASESREERLSDSIGLMVQRLAHELQNPLSGIKGATQLLERQSRNTPAFREYPGVILKELERLERLIKSLLAYGAESQLGGSTFNLHELLDEVIWFEDNAGARVTFVREYDPSLPELHADRDRMHQVFLNIIRNAVDASPADGVVRIRTGMRGPWENREGLPSRTCFAIEVEDEGPGVSEADLNRLFTPFFSTKKTGTGLGLPISHQLVRAHDGLLRYRPAPKSGSVFIVLLPLHERIGAV